VSHDKQEVWEAGIFLANFFQNFGIKPFPEKRGDLIRDNEPSACKTPDWDSSESSDRATGTGA
jgi:hypothetical protein